MLYQLLDLYKYSRIIIDASAHSAAHSQTFLEAQMNETFEIKIVDAYSNEVYDWEKVYCGNGNLALMDMAAVAYKRAFDLVGSVSKARSYFRSRMLTYRHANTVGVSMDLYVCIEDDDSTTAVYALRSSKPGFWQNQKGYFVVVANYNTAQHEADAAVAQLMNVLFQG